MTWGRFTLHGGFLILLAVMVWLDTGLFLWIAAASVLHELGHLLMLWVFGGRVRRLELGLLGIRMEAEGSLSYGKEVLITLGGPAASLLGALVTARLTSFLCWPAGFISAGIHLTLGLFNLLPVPSLDGGRALRLLLEWKLLEDKARAVSRTVGWITAGGVAAAGLVILLQTGYNFTLLASGGYALLFMSGGDHGQAIASRFAPRAKARPLCGRRIQRRHEGQTGG